MSELGRALIGLGLVLALAGVILTVWERFGLPRLPGDIVVRRGNFTFFFPLATGLLISIVLTLLLALFSHRKP